MTVAAPVRPDIEELPARPAERLPLAQARFTSVDALRGFIMFTMLFVNDVAGVRGAPAWMKHIHPSTANGMTFVDLVFPAFLFIVGLSIPIAFARRFAHGEPVWKILLHVIWRTLGLLLLGVFMVNEGADAKRMGWPGGLWEMLVYVFGIIAFLSPPRPARNKPALRYGFLAVRIIAFIGFIVLWRSYQDDKGHGMQTDWWGILGLIGWAYLVASILYLIFRRDRAMLVGSVAILLAMYIADKRGRFDSWFIGDWVSIGETLGSQASITVAGVILGTILLDTSMAFLHKLRWAAIFGVGLAIGAILLRRLYGINKNDATPSWCLWASAITSWLWIIFALLTAQPLPAPMKWIVNFFARGGENVLLAYMLMPLWYALLEMTGWEFYWRLGHNAGVGITRSLVAATACLALSIFLKDRGVRVRL